ncbi:MULTISPECIES: hypothetical protein [unclassified Roseitalea]|uniref:hypothetical protein n=1 Tax=unclassified Roseitalea TaxID=2639107 RepID=UPI00273F37D8|nr:MULTISPECIES: hypothetical protein [unclassified Roseitalea]
MHIHLKIATLVVAASAIAGCVETSEVATDDGLSGTQAQFNAMTAPCIDQAARFTGFPAIDINIVDRVRTGGGPLLVLDAGGQRVSCRREGDGSVTVFSEFAN